MAITAQITTVLPLIGVAALMLSAQLNAAVGIIYGAATSIFAAIAYVAAMVYSGVGLVSAASTAVLAAFSGIGAAVAAGADAVLNIAPWVAYVYDTLAAIIESGMDKIESQAARALGILIPIQFLAGGLGLSVSDLLGIGADLETPIAAETISQVQVMTDEDGDTTNKESRDRLHQVEIIELLRTIRDNVAAVGENRFGCDIQDGYRIVELCRRYLCSRCRTR